MQEAPSQGRVGCRLLSPPSVGGGGLTVPDCNFNQVSLSGDYDLGRIVQPRSGPLDRISDGYGRWRHRHLLNDLWDQICRTFSAGRGLIDEGFRFFSRFQAGAETIGNYIMGDIGCGRLSSSSR